MANYGFPGYVDLDDGMTVIRGEPPDYPPPEGTAAPQKLFSLEMCDTIKFDLDSEDLIDGVLPKVGVAMLYGKPATLKSFIAFDRGMSIAKGEDWGGRRVERGAVVYIAAEGQGGLRKRKVGYEKARGLLAGTPFALVPAAPNLGAEKGDLDGVIATIEGARLRPAFIVIDSVSKSLGSGDENGAGMQTLVNNAVALSLYFQCCVLLVHHVGVGENAEKRPCGFSGSTGGVEAQILCEREDKTLVAALTIQKQKDGEDGVTFAVDLERVEVGVNCRGKVHDTLVVSAVVEIGAVTPKAKPTKEPPRAARLLIDVVNIALNEAGLDFKPFVDGPSVPAVSDNTVRDRYYRRIAEPTDANKDQTKVADQRRQAFNRAIKGLLDAKAIAAQQHDGERLLWLL